MVAKDDKRIKRYAKAIARRHPRMHPIEAELLAMDAIEVANTEQAELRVEIESLRIGGCAVVAAATAREAELRERLQLAQRRLDDATEWSDEVAARARAVEGGLARVEALLAEWTAASSLSDPIYASGDDYAIARDHERTFMLLGLREALEGASGEDHG